MCKDKMIRIATAMTLVILLAGFGGFTVGPGAEDFSVQLCGDYYVHRTSVHQIKVSPMSWRDDTPIIPVKVVELGYDKRFIIAKQNHLKRRSPHDPLDTYMEPNVGVFSYWILDVIIPVAYGPLSQAEFDNKRKTIGVPHSLAMKDVYSYRK
jgi:hypothetical protein